MDVIDQVMIIYAGTKGYLDKVPIKEVLAWQDQFLHFVHEQRPQVYDALKKARKFSPEIERQLGETITAFGPQFKPAPSGPPTRPPGAIKQAETNIQKGH
jgi:F-type H+-transporting ATPase subunit alpha